MTTVGWYWNSCTWGNQLVRLLMKKASFCILVKNFAPFFDRHGLLNYSVYIARYGGYHFCRRCTARPGADCCDQCPSLLAKWRTCCYFHQGLWCCVVNVVSILIKTGCKVCLRVWIGGFLIASASRLHVQHATTESYALQVDSSYVYGVFCYCFIFQSVCRCY